MKSTATVIGASTVLTLVFYVLTYFFLPGPSPSAAMVMLFAGAAILIVVGVWAGYKDLNSKQKKRALQFLVCVGLVIAAGSWGLVKYNSWLARGYVRPPVGTESTGLDSPATAASSPRTATAASSPRRVTGNAILVSGGREENGYGLYSYALLAHAPSGDEVPRYKYFLKALLQLPPALSEVQVGRKRINITYLLLETEPDGWNGMPIDARVDYAISHYDYARSAVIIASLPGRYGTGPLITSALSPISGNVQPHPVLVQDLSRAQPVLMVDYVTKFVNQVANAEFWQQNALANFSLNLRNILETSANGVGMSKDAVASWVHYSK
jgi:hypothetical protein